MDREDKRLLARFGGHPDRMGLGMIIIDCSEENLVTLIRAAREQGRTSAEAKATALTEEVARLKAASKRYLDAGDAYTSTGTADGDDVAAMLEFASAEEALRTALEGQR